MAADGKTVSFRWFYRVFLVIIIIMMCLITTVVF